MTTYTIKYIYRDGSTTEDIYKEKLSEAVYYLASRYNSMVQKICYDGTGTLADLFVSAEIYHAGEDYVIASFTPTVLSAIYNAVLLTGFPQFGDPIEKIRYVRMELHFGGQDYILQARNVLKQFADISLALFNIPDADFPLPYCYNTVEDAKRKLQYLCEFCRIAEFQLSGTEPETW